ncbi:MAG: hypothetical protein LBK99_01565 [Opitutaceae bacterium]|jgi:hypothetical protein|nr:hypothetical protein [Opitutaceae bacterium]
MLTTGILDLDELPALNDGDCVEISRPGSPVNYRASIATLQESLSPMKTIITDIPPGADAVDVIFPVPYAQPPAGIFCAVMKPANGDTLFASPVTETITTAGFTSDLSGAPDGPGHKLVCIIIPRQ